PRGRRRRGVRLLAVESIAGPEGRDCRLLRGLPLHWTASLPRLAGRRPPVRPLSLQLLVSGGPRRHQMRAGRRQCGERVAPERIGRPRPDDETVARGSWYRSPE